MVSTDDVTITEHEDGSMSITDSVGTGGYVRTRGCRSREHFAAERMPDDVHALVERARDAAAFWTEAPQRLLHQLADALEAAYSQKGAGDDPR